MRHKGDPRRGLRSLTAAEARVTALLARGLPQAAVAAQLGLSVSTVGQHSQHAGNKLGLRGPLFGVLAPVAEQLAALGGALESGDAPAARACADRAEHALATPQPGHRRRTTRPLVPAPLQSRRALTRRLGGA